jgi:hypothetical protein
MMVGTCVSKIQLLNIQINIFLAEIYLSSTSIDFVHYEDFLLQFLHWFEINAGRKWPVNIYFSRLNITLFSGQTFNNTLAHTADIFMINYKDVAGLGVIRFSKQFLPWFMSGKFSVASFEYLDVNAGGF